MEEESGLARSEVHNGLRNFGQNHNEKTYESRYAPDGLGN